MTNEPTVSDLDTMHNPETGTAYVETFAGAGGMLDSVYVYAVLGYDLVILPDGELNILKRDGTLNRDGTYKTKFFKRIKSGTLRLVLTIVYDLDILVVATGVGTHRRVAYIAGDSTGSPLERMWIATYFRSLEDRHDTAVWLMAVLNNNNLDGLSEIFESRPDLWHDNKAL